MAPELKTLVLAEDLDLIPGGSQPSVTPVLGHLAVSCGSYRYCKHVAHR